ncbi:ATP-binding protein [Thermomonospora umbrina]|uniref:Histidine kinase-like protein n=1 Tax=Thermomonospora umbrina TaxID=111806 RepID=A0A3D9SXY8_9ACTN|nr:ATP-binding protein [Thermomonospora umbrina]REF00817.1 histidine kinase-like protein [Thermomonospora umbrina]
MSPLTETMPSTPPAASAEESAGVVTCVWGDGHHDPAARARRLVHETLEAMGVDADAIDDAALMCSELVANAFAYGRGPRALRLRVSGEALLCEVLDSDTEHLPRWPGAADRRQPSSDDDALDEAVAALSDHGRGLHLVRALSHGHGCYLTTLDADPAVPAKSVWFLQRHRPSTRNGRTGRCAPIDKSMTHPDKTDPCPGRQARSTE